MPGRCGQRLCCAAAAGGGVVILLEVDDAGLGVPLECGVVSGVCLEPNVVVGVCALAVPFEGNAARITRAAVAPELRGPTVGALGVGGEAVVADIGVFAVPLERVHPGVAAGAIAPERVLGHVPLHTVSREGVGGAVG